VKQQLKETAEYISFEIGLAVAYARHALQKLEEKPWFPRRKVIAGAIAAAATGFLSRKLGIDVDLVVEALITGVSGGFVAWLIPEAPDKR